MTSPCEGQLVRVPQVAPAPADNQIVGVAATALAADVAFIIGAWGRVGRWVYPVRSRVGVRALRAMRT